MLFVQPVLNPPGGANGVAVWALLALRNDYQIDLLTWAPVDFGAINRFYGTPLDPAGYRRIHAPGWLRRLIDLDPDPFSFQPAALLIRWAKIIHGKYDLALCFFDEVDLGERAIQYIHFPHAGRIYREQQRLERIPEFRGRWQAALFRHRPWRAISGFSFERMKRNVTLVNSDWTRQQVKQEYGIDARVLYPPVTGDFPEVPWAERENGFVCIGRISPKKRFEEIVAIIAGVRATGHAVHLHIVGALGGEKAMHEYYGQVRQLVEENAGWVSLHENISRGELVQLIAHHRYGIHGNVDEHFGIAVAEMVRGGCVVFVPDSGGQVEILGGDARLLYASADQAVRAIARVIEDAEAQRQLRAMLQTRGEMFTVEQFTRNLRAIVAQSVSE